MAGDATPIARLVGAARALHARMSDTQATPMSPAAFHHRQGAWTYEPPPVATNQLYVAPEVTTLRSPPSPTTELYEAAMCLRALVEGEERIEEKFLKDSGERTLGAVWARWPLEASLEVPRPPRRAYRGMEGVCDLLDRMTRRDPTERPQLPRGLLDLVDAVGAAPAAPSVQGADDEPGRGAPGPVSLQRSDRREVLIAGLGGLVVGGTTGWLLGRGGGEEDVYTPVGVLYLDAMADAQRFLLLPGRGAGADLVQLRLRGVGSPTASARGGLWLWSKARLADPTTLSMPPGEPLPRPAGKQVGSLRDARAWHDALGRPDAAGDLRIRISLAPGAGPENRWLGADGSSEPRAVTVTPASAGSSPSAHYLIARIGLNETRSFDLLA